MKKKLRVLNRKKPYRFKTLWRKLQEFIVENLKTLPVDFGPEELWIYMLEKRWMHETNQGTVIVRVS